MLRITGASERPCILRKTIVVSDQFKISRIGSSYELDEASATYLGHASGGRLSRSELALLGPMIDENNESQPLGDWLCSLLDGSGVRLCRADTDDEIIDAGIIDGNASVRCSARNLHLKSYRHQINNHLNNISLNAELLRLNAARYGDKALDNTAKQIVAACREAAQYQNDPGETRNTDPQYPAISVIRSLVEGSAEQAIELRIRCREQLPLATCSHVANFLLGAAQASGVGLHVSAHGLPNDDADLSIDANWPGDLSLLEDFCNAEWAQKSGPLALMRLPLEDCRFRCEITDSRLSLWVRSSR